MPRITCRVPSTGRPTPVYLNNTPTAWTTIAEAPDFSVPDSSNQFPARDPLDATRAIRPGEVVLLTPLTVYNKDTFTRRISVGILRSTGVFIQMHRVSVPALDSVQLPIQMMSLLKRDADSANGDRLQVQADVAGTLEVAAMAEERPSSEHLGVVT
jgi:hypothetical protein